MKLLFFTIIFKLLILNLYATNYINVKDFGAKGNGKTDDTKAIQAALNSTSPLLKTIIYFPKGIYIIGSYKTTSNYLENYCLGLRSNVSIKGDGENTIIRLADHIFDKTDTSANAHLFYGYKIKDVSFSNLIIDMNGANNLVPPKIIKNYSAIFISYGVNFHIHDITIKNCSGTNMVNVMNRGRALVIENCKFINGGNYVGTAIANKNQYDFSFIYSEWDSTIITNNLIQQQDVDLGLSNYSGGIELHGSFSTASDNFIEGCWPAIYITSSNNEILKNVSIQSNNIINCVTGISFWLIYPMENISICNNKISLTASRSSKLNLCAGIIVPNGNAKEYNRNLANAAPIVNLQIVNNTISSDSMHMLSAGMILHSLQKSIIQNNVIKGLNYGGVILSGSKWGMDSLIVKNNIFKDFRPNNDKNTVAAYVIVIDTYTSSNNEAFGFRRIVFRQNKFLQGKNIMPGKGKFFGAFMALPSVMMKEIIFDDKQLGKVSQELYKVIINPDK